MGGAKSKLFQKLLKISCDSVCPTRPSDTFNPLQLLSRIFSDNDVPRENSLNIKQNK